MQEPSVDFLHARTSALHNHLIEASDGRLFLITNWSDQNGFTVQEVVKGEGAALSFSLKAMTNIVLTDMRLPLPALTSPSLDPSLVLVNCSAINGQEGYPQGGSLQGHHEAFLVSSGLGDLSLIYRTNPRGPMRSSPLLFPLRPLPPIIGCRPLSLEAGYFLPNGLLRVIAWGVKPPSSSSSSSRRSVCETFSVTLSLTTLADPPSPFIAPDTPPQTQVYAEENSISPPLSLEVVDIHTLRLSPLPPHFVLPDPQGDRILMALDPESCEPPPSLSSADTVGHRQAQDEVIDLDCRMGGEGGRGESVDDDEDCDMDPRTLAQAAARLAKYTQDMEDDPGAQGGEGGGGGGGSGPRWCDVYKETGQDGVGAMGSEESVDFIVLPCSSLADIPRATWHLSCGASKALSFEGTGRNGALVALSDDVDGAVLAIEWPLGKDPSVKHSGYVDALAYIAAGKVHKKHLLVGSNDSPIAAILVESKKFYYVYHKHSSTVGGGVKHGLQDVVDMDLQEGEMVMGARLIGPSGRQVLLILTQHRLIWHTLRAA